MDTAGKAVLFSGVTVLISLSAVMLVPSPAFRSMALGIMLSVAFILLATLTLLPAVLGVARRPRRQARAAVGPRRRAPLAALRALGRAALAPPGAATACPPLAVLAPARRARPPARHRDAVDQGRPDGRRLAQSATPRCRRRSAPGAPGTLQVVAPASRRGPRDGRRSRPTRGSSRSLPRTALGRRGARARGPRRRSHRIPSVGATIERLRAALPAGALVGGAAAENHDLEAALAAKTAAGLPRRPRPRLPAPAGRPAGAADRAGGRADEPPRHGSGVRRRRARSSRTATSRGSSASSRRGS